MSKSLLCSALYKGILLWCILYKKFLWGVYKNFLWGVKIFFRVSSPNLFSGRFIRFYDFLMFVVLGRYIKTFYAGGSKNFLSKIKISFFHNVELDELITNYPNCKNPSCTFTELFVLLNFKCIVFLGGLKKICCFKSKFLFFRM